MIQPLVGKQRTSVELATARINLWEGSVRSSKTICSLLWWLRYVRTGPAGNLVMVGKTERTLKRNIIDPLVDMLGRKRCRHVQGEGELWLLGRRIYLAGANDERSQEKIRGLTLAGAYVDEVSLIPESFWAMLLTRLSIEGAQVGGTTNPDNPNHWLMRDYLKRASVWLRHDGTVVHRDGSDTLDLARFSFRLADNPNLSASYVDALSREFVGLWRKRFIDGLWVIADGSVYDMWDEDRHVIETLPTDDGGRTDCDRWIVAVDYGTVNPFVALLIGVSSHRRRLYVAAEYRHDAKAERRQLTDADYSAAMREWLNGETGREDGWRRIDAVYVDPSASSFLAQLHRDGWGSVRGADNAVLDGIRDVSSLLAAGMLQVHESCAGLRGEMPGYVWDAKAAKHGVEQPLKVDDHGPDALRYGVRATGRWWRHWLVLPADADEAA